MIAALTILAGTFTARAQDSPLSLWYLQPAPDWQRALAIGNGSLGGMIFGGAASDHIQFNEQTLWLGSETKIGKYQPFGDFYVEWKHANPTDYRRELSLADAIHRVRYRDGGVTFRRESFCSRPDQVMVFHFTADKPGAYTGSIRMTDAHKAQISAEGDVIASVGKLSNGLEYEARLRVLHDGGRIAVEGGTITVTGANSVTLLLAAATSFANDPLKNWRGEPPHGRVVSRLEAAAKKSFGQLRAAHVADYQALFNRVALDLGPAPKDLPTDARVRERKARKGTSGNDPALDALQFQYGRYLLIAGSRPGGLPLNLRGIWNPDLRPPWNCAYTTDINVEMAYWAADVTGLPECEEPYFHWVRNMAVVYKRTQDERVKAPKGRGWSSYNTLNPFGGPSVWAVHRPQSAWLVHQFWEHYAFTQDKEFLRGVAYPAMKEIVEFWEDRLVEGPGGTLITPDGWSPEHGPVMKDGKIVIKEGDRTPHPGTSYDQEIVWDLFNNFVEASTVLGVDKDYRAKVAAMRDRLLKPKIGRWGQLQEWMEDVDLKTDHHRHLSHLFALFPGRQIDPVATPELAKAAQVSLEARGDYPNNFSRTWKILLWARLRNGDKAHLFIDRLFQGNFNESLFNTPPWGLTANFGYPAGVAEMLLQSQTRDNGERVLQLLPALPKAWPNGSVRGLRARGGFVVDIAWKEGSLATAAVRSLAGNPCKVRYGEAVRDIKLAAGAEYLWK